MANAMHSIVSKYLVYSVIRGQLTCPPIRLISLCCTHTCAVVIRAEGGDGVPGSDIAAGELYWSWALRAVGARVGSNWFVAERKPALLINYQLKNLLHIETRYGIM